MHHRHYFAIIVIALNLAGCAGEGVSPGSRDDFYRSGETERFTMKVDLSKAAPSQEPLDVLLLFDSTGSMGNVISEVRDNAQDIMLSVRGVYADSAFGVAALFDYDTKKEPFILYQDVTTEMPAVSTALGKLAALGGKDWPEAYSRALYESQYISWRPDARKYVVLFGDAPAHDPTFYGTDYGIDPGRDRQPGTPDDLYLKDVVALLARNGISVISVFDRGPWYKRKPNMDDAIKGFDYISAQTKGLSIPVGSSRDVPDAIKAGVRNTRPVPPGVFVPSAVRDWVDVDPARSKDSAHKRFAFPTRVHPPPATPAGVYRFPLIAMHGGKTGGGEIGRTWVTVRVGRIGINWRLLVLWIPLLVLLLWALRRRLRGNEAVRYVYNGLWAKLLLNVFIILVAAVVVPFALWRFIPEPPVKTIADRSVADLVSAAPPPASR